MNIFIGALILSIWHSILFWDKEIGLSALLFAIPLIYVTVKILKGKTENKKALLLSIPIILLSSTYFLFNNSLFNALNIVIIPLLYIIMMMLATTKELKIKSIIFKILAVIIEPFNYFGEVVVELKNKILPSKEEKQEKREKKNIIKAIILTGLIVIIVLILLASADSEFASLFFDILDAIINLSLPSLVIRIGVIILLFFYISSFFINILSKGNGLNEINNEEENNNKENLTINMILTTLNIIYLIFCFTQIKQLLTVEDIIYSEFARKGFFQLMLVTLINLLVILKATSKDLKETEKQEKYKKAMCIIMIIFTFILIILSFAKMNLYISQYGDTRLRLLVNFTLLTETILLIPTSMYIINSKVNLARTYLIIITTMYCMINFANIDNVIAKRNIQRFEETGKIDIWYLTGELDKATIVEEVYKLKSIKPEAEIQNEYIKNNLNTYINKFIENTKSELPEETSIQEFNLTKWKAKKFIKEEVRY